MARKTPRGPRTCGALTCHTVEERVEDAYVAHTETHRHLRSPVDRLVDQVLFRFQLLQRVGEPDFTPRNEITLRLLVDASR
eukprot:443481-Prorocentrum_minimum.AAC.2